MRTSPPVRDIATRQPRHQRLGRLLQQQETSPSLGNENACYGLRISGMSWAGTAGSLHVFGSARSHHAYLFLNRRTNRLKVLVHDGFGLWLCARRLQQGRFVRPDTHLGSRLELTSEQLQALVVGLPWQRLSEYARISVL